MSIIKRSIAAAAVCHAVLSLSMKWLMAVMIRKIIEESFRLGSTDGSFVRLLEPQSSLWRLLFLDGVSFPRVALLSGGVAVSLAAMTGILNFCASMNAERVGRMLRGAILECSVDGSGAKLTGDEAAGADIGRKASELILKVKVVEMYKKYDEYWLLSKTVSLALSFALVFVFNLYAGLIAVGMFVAAELSGMIFVRLRAPSECAIESTQRQVNARLLDVVKNGICIKMMNMTQEERKALEMLEAQSDSARSREAHIQLFGDLTTKSLIYLIPGVTAVALWSMVQTVSPEKAITAGFSLLAALLLLDEGHICLIRITTIKEKKTNADEAMEAIKRFIGDVQYDQKPYDDKPEMTSTEPTQNGWDCITCDEKQELTARHDYVELGGEDSFGYDILSPPRLLQLSDVTLHYEGIERGQAALKNFSLSLERGKIHGLIGESGSGKSSVLKLLAGCVLPTNGGTVELWSDAKISYLAQGACTFSRSIREIVTYGDKNEAVDEDIWKALRKACIEEWVSSLPMGLDYVLKTGEQEISGGQLQRLHLAHMFCTGQSSELVLLDECISALDPHSRNFVIDQLRLFLNGKTAIIATHLSEMLQLCDQVYEMIPNSSRAVAVGEDIAIEFAK